MVRREFVAALARLVLCTCVALCAGACVSRQPAELSAMFGTGRTAPQAVSIESGGGGGGARATPNAASPPRANINSQDWPRRYLLAELFEADLEVALVAAPGTGPPEERHLIGHAGVGRLERVEVDRLADPDVLRQLRDERGFREWLVFQTCVRYADVDPIPYGLLDVPAETLSKRYRLVEISETSFAIHLPPGTPRGLVVQMTNLAGNTEWERQLTETFRNRGWAVLSTFVPDGWALDTALRVDAAADPVATGRALARAIDDRLAEWAYGVEAVLDYMATNYPQVPQDPLVGIGSSAGAISLPAVAARLGRPFDATVLIGGGIDGLEVLRRTTLGNTPLRLEWESGHVPSEAVWAQIRAAYVDAVRLDGVHTVVHLRGTPVLLLHAAWDRIVDARCGEALWEALGRPERWTYQAGHLGLFLFWLPREAERVAGWVEAIVRESRRSNAASG